MIQDICVLCPYGLDAGLLSKAVSLAGGAPVRALVPEADSTMAAEFGASYIHVIAAAPEDENALLPWLKEKLIQWGCRFVFAPATVQLRNLMPMLAWELKAGLTADCTELTAENDYILQTRPAFGNSLVATIQSLSSSRRATVRPGTFPSFKRPEKNTEIIKEAFSATCNKITVTGVASAAESTPLTQAQIIVAGGAGIGSREGFKKLEMLAKKLGGAVAASRNAVDAGYAPYSFQVGMTGITIAPKLYIAVGISGAVQHLAGIQGAGCIVAVNKDKKAPIFDHADIGIVDDCVSFLQNLQKKGE